MEQAAVKEGRELVLEQMILYQLFGDEQFYAAMPPATDDLYDRCRAAYRQALDHAMGKADCTGCVSLKSILTPIQNDLGKRLAAVHAEQADALEPLVALIAKRRGYRPRPVTLYFKDAGRTQRLSF